MRRVDATHAPARAQGATAAGGSTAVHRLSHGHDPATFRIRHQGVARRWVLELDAGDGTLTWILPGGLPIFQGEARPMAPGTPGGEGPLWDAGTWRCAPGSHDGVVLHLDGRRVRGRYAMDGEGDTLWRLDPASLRPPPARLLPMLAHTGPYPRDPQAYAFEPKWDGMRALVHAQDGRVRIRSRTAADVTRQYPEILALGLALGGSEVVLDGEIVALDEAERPDFQRLQRRMTATTHRAVQREADATPVSFVAFDLLHAQGHDLTGQPYEIRRQRLVELELEGRSWWTTPSVAGDGRAFLADPRHEGVVAKRLGSTYEPGARSRAWIKVKRQRRQELVIGGYTPGRGARRSRLGALLVGAYDRTAEAARRAGAPQRLHYAGAVGTGFTDEDLRRLEERLKTLRIGENPFDAPVPKADATFVAPVLVGEFEFTEWTRDGRMRHPSFKGLRTDKDPRDVVREET